MKKNEQTGKYISYLSRLMHQHALKNFSKHGLSTIEYSYLMILRDGNPKSQQTLSNELLVDKAQTTRAVNSLVEKGLVQKMKSNQDKRSFLVSLTDKGYDLIPSISKEITSFENTLNKGISKQDQRHMKSLLIKMIRNMKKEEGEGI